MIVFLELFDHTLYIRKNKKKVSSSYNTGATLVIIEGSNTCMKPHLKGY